MATWENFLIPSKIIDGKDEHYYYIRIPDGEYKGAHYLCPVRTLWNTKKKIVKKMSYIKTALFLIETTDGLIHEVSADSFIRSFNKTHKETIPKLYGGLR